MKNDTLKEGIDFYQDAEGRMVFTADYLLRRGYCCESGCRHCPYGDGEEESITKRKKLFPSVGPGKKN